MSQGKRTKSKHGTLTGEFDPFLMREELFRIGSGQQTLQPDHGYPLLEKLRIAKYAFDKHKSKIPKGYRHKFLDQLTAACQNAALIEIQHQAEVRLLNKLHGENCLSGSVYKQNLSEIEDNYMRLSKEAAYAAAAWLSHIEAAISPRQPGRPSNKVLPDESDLRDWQVIMDANSRIDPQSQEDNPLEKCLNEIPNAVRRACGTRLLIPNEDGRIIAIGKQYEAHIKRISSKCKKWLGD